MISTELLSILCCPACHGELIHNGAADTLTCRACRRVYRIEEEIPVLVVGEERRES